VAILETECGNSSCILLRYTVYFDIWSCCITSHPGQLSLLPSEGWEISTAKSVMVLCGWGMKAGMACSTCGLNMRVTGIGESWGFVRFGHTLLCLPLLYKTAICINATDAHSTASFPEYLGKLALERLNESGF